MINEGIFWAGGIMTSIVIAIITAYLNRLIRELDEAKKEIDVSKTEFTKEVSVLKSRIKVVENQLSNDVINLSKQIELLQGSIRHLENTITANAQAMYTLFMDFKNDKK
jgi:hypothetical protein